MISTNNISLRYGGRVLFEDVNVKIYARGTATGL